MQPSVSGQFARPRRGPGAGAEAEAEAVGDFTACRILTDEMRFKLLDRFGGDDMDPERRLFARFEEMGIASKTVEHDATATVADSIHLAESLPGGRSKSLLLEDRDSRLFLVTALGRNRADLKKIGAAVGARGRLSFAEGALMQQVLGVGPGHLTPFALINDPDLAIDTLVLDEELMAHEDVWAHPLRNTASTRLAATDLRRFAELHAAKVLVMGLAQD